ncbi:MAG: sigma factor [Myxococcota bacterium]
MDDVESIARALREHGEALRAFVRARVPRADVDDVLQTAALRAVEGSASLKDPERILAWLYRIHRNAVHDSRRSRARSDRVMAAHIDEVPENPIGPEAEICGCSLSQMKRVRPSYASMLSLVDAGGASLAEAAQLLEISVQNAAVRLHRARRALRTRMREHCGVERLRDCLDCRCAQEGCCAI